MRASRRKVVAATVADTQIGANAGGRPARLDQPSAFSSSEEHILRCLGAAVIDQWSDLPTNVQRLLFDRATALGAPRHASHLKDQIARFLHTHKDDIRPNP